MRFPADCAQPLRAIFGGADEAPHWSTLDEKSAEHLVRALAAHGVLPLFHAAASQERAAGTPLTIRRVAEANYMAAAAQAALRLRELRDVLSSFDTLGVEALVLKGAALAETVYENVALRPMGDLDLLVRERDLETAGEALLALGYREDSGEAPDLSHHRAFVRLLPSGVYSAIELHRRPFATPPFDRALPADQLFERSRLATIGGRTVPVPSDVDMLLHLSGHLVLQHARSERLIWVADVDRVARLLNAEMWQEAIERADASSLAPSLSDALAVAVIWFGTPIPSGVNSSLEIAIQNDPDTVSAHSRVRARAPIGHEGARRLTDLKGVDGLLPKLRFALAFAFPPPSFMREHYGVDRISSLSIYYARRIVRGLVHVVSELLWRRSDALATDEPPERWMVESDPSTPLD